MKKRGGSLENNKLIFYVVAVIAFFNIIAFLTARDWNSIIFFGLAGFVSYTFKLSPTLCLIISLVSANVFRASKSLQEGLTTEEPTELKPVKKNVKPDNNLKLPQLDRDKKPIPEPSNDTKTEKKSSALTAEHFEGLTNTAEGLMKRQDKLHELAGQLGPLMKQASAMMKHSEKFFKNK